MLNKNYSIINEFVVIMYKDVMLWLVSFLCSVTSLSLGLPLSCTSFSNNYCFVDLVLLH